MKTHIILLGDCQSNGNNCLAHEILDEKSSNSLQTWSLRYHKKLPQAFRWMVKHINRNGNDAIHDTTDISTLVWGYLRQQEMKVAWPEILNIKHNYSVNGAHYVGYCKRLLSHIEKHGVPEHVIITDYTYTHRSVTFKHSGKRYYFEKAEYSDADWDQSAYPLEVHNLLKTRLTYQNNQTINWHLRKHEKSYRMLLRLLAKYNIPWSTVIFDNHFKNFISVDVNCNDFYTQYHTDEGENSRVKLELQNDIASRVQESLK
jgi:hypothetical protein